MAVTIGELRDRISIQARSGAQDETGEPISEWVEVAAVSASVRDLLARELLAAAAAQSQITTKIVIRYRDGIAPDMRAVRGSELFHIQAVMNMSGRRDWMELMCVKGMPDA